MSIVIRLLRALCLLAFGAAALHLAGLMPAGWFSRAPMVAGVLLVLHTLELPIALRHLRADHRPLWAGIALTLLYGVLHWKPLADAARARQGS